MSTVGELNTSCRKLFSIKHFLASVLAFGVVIITHHMILTASKSQLRNERAESEQATPKRSTEPIPLFTTVTNGSIASINTDLQVASSKIHREITEKTVNQEITIDKILAYNDSTSSHSGPKLKSILFWTKYYKDSYFGIRGTGREPFLKNHCKVNTCTATNDVTMVKDADAIVLHMRDPMYPFPTRRDERQLFVFFLHEAPPATFYNYHTSIRPDHASMFNVTISYRQDSDISMFYCGEVREHRHPGVYQVSTFQQKTRNVVWMSSHCRTDSKRELYIRALAKFIDVDVYGRCGNLTCPKSEGTECEKHFQFKYKFFVAAENAICKDYVTEKLGRGMSWEMIPIVYGGVNYTASLPPKSVIDITEFDSPEHLAKHLKFLSENEAEYAKYFEWKGKYGMKRVTKTMAMCDLCQKLHDPTYHKTYPDIVKWWKEDICSTSFMDKLQDRGLV